MLQYMLRKVKPEGESDVLFFPYCTAFFWGGLKNDGFRIGHGVCLCNVHFL